MLHHSGALRYPRDMATRRKAAPAKSLRQSVTIPAPLLAAVRRTAKEQHLTMSRALVALAERGLQAELEAKQQLKTSYNRFLAEKDPALKNEAGKDLIRAIFGKDAIAEDPVL
jgi:hypothetical protein